MENELWLREGCYENSERYSKITWLGSEWGSKSKIVIEDYTKESADLASPDIEGIRLYQI
jgi:hypothetical protein